MDTAPNEHIHRWRERLKAGRSAAIERFRQTGRAAPLLHALRREVDAVIIEAARAFDMPRASAIVAVGGYGRGELFPYSDVDLLLLFDMPIDESLHRRISDFLGLCWDLGLEIGHSVRTVDECLQQAAADITVQTSLIEARYLCGSRTLFKQLTEGVRAHLDSRHFFRAKVLELKQRYAKYEDTPYSLEPNCKESPGGLRDLQVILWVARAAHLGTDWRALHSRGLITRAETAALSRNERVLKDIRIRLHLLSGRREDRLVFDVQNALAADMGLKAVGSRRASEVLMQRYYWAAKAVVQLNTLLLQNMEERIFALEHAPARPINAHFNNVNDLLDIARDDVFERTPSAMLEAFLVMQQTPELKGMSARTLRALWHSRERIDPAFRRDPRNRALFLSILQQPRGIVHELRRMNQTSVLGRYLPVFRRIVGQMQHDLFHVYTVDQHIMQVVRNLRRLTMADHAHEYPYCSRLMANFDRQWLLYVAALFHDIAKGRGGDHSELGRLEVRRFCRAHGLSDDDRELVEFLVQHHLTMSRIAQKQDLSDPAVIRGFADLVRTERRLTGLYLLTVADVRGTSPKVWNAWKAKLLEDLFRMTLRALGGAAPNAHAELEERQEEARRILRLYAFSPTVHEDLWRQLDVAFFLRQDAQTIAWLTRNLHYRVDSPQPVVKARLALIGEGIQVAVYAKDQPDLFARICGYFDNRRYSILDAKVHTTRHGYALDTFIVVDAQQPANSFNDYRSMTNIIEDELAGLIARQGPLPEPARSRVSRQSRHFPILPSVDLRPDERGQYHLLCVTAADRSGLLYAIARVLGRYGVNLHTARILTLGERVEDVFLVDGQTLSNAKTQIRLETELLDVLAVPDAAR